MADSVLEELTMDYGDDNETKHELAQMYAELLRELDKRGMQYSREMWIHKLRNEGFKVEIVVSRG